jgi:hypothetical protein
MQEFYLSDRVLGITEVAEISHATGGQFGYTRGVIKNSDGKYKFDLILPGDSIPFEVEKILKARGLHKLKKSG